jgi:transcriptional regulator with XRE-family HTH domain
VKNKELTEEELLSKIGRRIVQLREEKGIKQIELAIRLNIEDSSLRRIESGRTNPTTKTLYRIAKELGVDITELF